MRADVQSNNSYLKTLISPQLLRVRTSPLEYVLRALGNDGISVRTSPLRLWKENFTAVVTVFRYCSPHLEIFKSR